MPPTKQQQGGSQGGEGGSQNASDLFWIIAIVVVAVLIFWYFKKEAITRVIFWVRAREIALIEWSLHEWADLLVALKIRHWLSPEWASFLLPDLGDLGDWSQYIREANPAYVEFNVIKDLSLVVGYYLKYPVALVSLVMAALMYFKHSGSRYSNRMDMKKLRHLESSNWPYITPVVHRKNLIKVPLEKGPWSMAQNAMQFSKSNGLLEEYKKNYKPAVRLLQDKAARVLALQMGPLWNGPAKMPIYAKALFAVFAAKGNQDEKSANRLLAKIARSAKTGGRLDFSGTQLLLIKYVRTRVVGYAVCRHAYVLTAMASMLELARTDGVLATAEFIWLKKVDRLLWLMLNTVGRQTAFCEVAGPYAHWLMEKKLGRPMKVPMVKEGIVALNEAILDILYDPEDKLND